MPGLRAGQLQAVVAEIAPWVVGGHLQRIHQPEPLGLTLQIYSQATTLHLYLCAQAQFSRIHLVQHRKPNPATPPGFCQLLRKHLQGGRILALEQVAGDRIVKLTVQAQEQLQLIGELIGVHGNLVLINSQGQILGAARVCHRRGILPGKHYQPPPPPPAAKGASQRSIDLEPLEQGVAFPWSRAIEAYYQDAEAAATTQRLRQRLLSLLGAECKKLAQQQAKLEQALEDSAQWERWQQYGELLKAQLHSIQRGQEEITVVNYYDPTAATITIPLDPKGTPQENMQRYFKRARKLRNGQQYLQQEIAQRQERRANLEQLRQAAIQARPEELPSLVESLPPHLRQRCAITPVAAPRTRSESPRRRPYHVFHCLHGNEILVGRTAADNDTLTFKVARGNDLWLHTQDYPGSHVILRTGRQAPAWESILDAAHLAAYFSQAREHGKIAVVYTPRKHVARAGKTPGRVTYSTHKSILITLAEERLNRLLQRTKHGV